MYGLPAHFQPTCPNCRRWPMNIKIILTERRQWRCEGRNAKELRGCKSGAAELEEKKDVGNRKRPHNQMSLRLPPGLDNTQGPIGNLPMNSNARTPTTISAQSSAAGRDRSSRSNSEISSSHPRPAGSSGTGIPPTTQPTFNNAPVSASRAGFPLRSPPPSGQLVRASSIRNISQTAQESSGRADLNARNRDRHGGLIGRNAADGQELTNSRSRSSARATVLRPDDGLDGEELGLDIGSWSRQTAPSLSLYVFCHLRQSFFKFTASIITHIIYLETYN